MNKVQVAPTTEVFWLQAVDEDGTLNIFFNGHTTPISVTTSTNLVSAVINGVNNDANAEMTATGGGSNKIIFESKTAGTNDNGMKAYLDFDPTWMDPNSDVFSAYELTMSGGQN